MTGFCEASFICSSVRVTLSIVSMTNALVMEKIGIVKTCPSVRSTKKICQSKLSLIVCWPAVYCTLCISIMAANSDV